MTTADLLRALIPALQHLVEASVRGIALSATAGLVLAIARTRRASHRGHVWTAVLCLAFAMPALSAIVPSELWRVPLSNRAAGAAGITVLADPKAVPSTSLSARRVDLPPADVAPSPARVIDAGSTGTRSLLVPRWEVVAAAMYLAGLALMLGRLFIGWHLTRRLVRSSRSLNDQHVVEQLRQSALAARVRTMPSLKEADELLVPITVSVAHPAIILPAAWRQWHPALVHAVLAHEIAHVARRDALTRWLSLAYRSLYWFNPLSWWLARHLADLAEEACDDAALERGASQTDYADALLGFLAVLRREPGRVHWQALAMARGTNAAHRIERILAWKPESRLASRHVVVSASLIALLIAGVAASSVQLVAVDRHTGLAPATAASEPIRLDVDLSLGTSATLAPAQTQTVVPTTTQDRAPHSSGATFCGDVPNCRPWDPKTVSWLASAVGQSTYYVTQDDRFALLMTRLVPDAMFHYRVDMPLAEAMRLILSGPARKVTGRDDRFVLLSGCADSACRQATAFVWIDTRIGVAIGGLEFTPTNGEPSPTLTIFSSQLDGKITKPGQLPPAFLEDLGNFARDVHIPPIAARYFINRSGWKSVLPHDELTCGATSRDAAAATPCTPMHLNIAQQDLAAAVHVLLDRFVEGSDERQILQTAQEAWMQSRDAACPPSADDALACRISFTRVRVARLASPDFRPGDK